MGVPYFFKYLINKYPSIIQELQKDDRFLHYHISIDHFAIDCNGIFYLCRDRIIQKYARAQSIELTVEQLEQEFMLMIFFYIEELVWRVKPQKSLLIVLDGISPMAKHNQQRQRRWNKKDLFPINKEQEEEKDVLEQLLQRLNFTSGTPFMASTVPICFDFFIQRKIQDDKNWQTISILFSDSSTVGEGEHKIMNYLKQNCLAKETICIYGMDADLILLSLLFTNPVYIFREAVLIETVYSRCAKLLQKRRKKKSMVFANADEKKFQFISISTLKNCLQVDYSISKDNLLDFCLDYIFVTLFLGNDFIPPLFYFLFTAMNEQIISNLFEKFYLFKKENPNKHFVHYNNQHYSFDLETIFEFLKLIEPWEQQVLLFVKKQIISENQLKQSSSPKVFVSPTIDSHLNNNLISLIDFNSCQLRSKNEEMQLGILKKLLIRSAMLQSPSTQNTIIANNFLLIHIQFTHSVFVSSFIIQNEQFDENEEYKVQILFNLNHKPFQEIIIKKQNQNMEKKIGKLTKQFYIFIVPKQTSQIQIDKLLFFGREESKKKVNNSTTFTPLFLQQSVIDNEKYYKLWNQCQNEHEMCQQYWSTLTWIINYYTLHHFSQISYTQYYPFYFCPFVKDLIQFSNSTVQVSKEMNYLTPLEQLVSLYPTKQLQYFFSKNLIQNQIQVSQFWKEYQKPPFNDVVLELPFYDFKSIQQQCKEICDENMNEQLLQQNTLHCYTVVKYCANKDQQKVSQIIKSPLQALPDIFDPIVIDKAEL